MVKHEHSFHSDKTEEPTLSAVLGLRAPADGDWMRVHGVQYAAANRRWGARLTLTIAGIALAWFTLSPHVGFLWLGLWTAVMSGIAGTTLWNDLALKDADERPFVQRDLNIYSLTAAVKAACWAALMILFIPQADIQAAGVMWGYLSMLMLSAAVSRYNPPLGSFLLCLIVGIGGAAGLWLAGHNSLVFVALMTTLLAAGGTAEGAKAAYMARIAERGMTEKSEVVSLLLREYEDSDADWLFQLDTNRRLRSVSPRLAFALGKELAEIEGKSFLQLISGPAWESGNFAQSLHDLAEKLKRRENFSNLVVQVDIDGQQRWWELSGTPMLDDSGRYIGFRGVGSDVTAQRESSEKIAYLARYDTLTSLPNRLFLNECLGDALKYAAQWRTRCAFLMLDLDRFKAVNDSLGHQVGDELLAQVASRLQAIMGENELCGRLGGDEFGIVIRDAADRSRISSVADAVIKSLSEPYKVGNQVLYVGVSVGSAIGPRDGSTVEELMRNADLSLYRAKDTGGGAHCEYEPSLHANAEERRRLEFSLRSALKNSELSLNYQPVVDAQTESLVSFEALVRWSSAEHGFVSPGKFIPLAEDTRLIVPIGQWVMEQACIEAASWPQHIKVNVNVSPEQLIEPDFVASVTRALSQSGLPAHRLEIEVTESIFLRDANIARKALEEVKALGCSIALDDFGTGYSSLGYLRKLRFSTIKVDRLFVQGASQQSAESLAIIRAVVAMADSLDMTTTAEGVETAKEAALIRELGCTKIQGFHFGRPMPVEDLQNLFHRESRRQRA